MVSVEIYRITCNQEPRYLSKDINTLLSEDEEMKLHQHIKRSTIFLNHVKEEVYINSPASIQDLKDDFLEDIGDLRQPLTNLFEEIYMKRIWFCRRGRGGHSADDIYHY